LGKKRKTLKQYIKNQWAVKEKSENENKKIIKWSLGFLGISVAAALLWSWWKNKAKATK